MPVHPDAQKYLDLTAGAVPLDTQSAEQNRADQVESLPLRGEAVEMHSVRDTEIGGVPVRVYVPFESDGPLPCVIYFHGGGWVIGNRDMVDTTVREIAAEAGAIGVNVEYRLAPEHPFPAAIDDATAVVTAILDGDSGLDIAADKVAVAGDSAGGNISAVIAQQLRGRTPALAHQVLIYPVTDVATADTGSYAEFAEGHFLTARDMAYFIDQYAGDADRNDPRLSPIRSGELGGLPPATVVIAECDPLADDGRAYARALLAAGNRVSTVEFMGQVHPFVSLGGIIDDAHVARQLIGRRLKAAFAQA